MFIKSQAVLKQFIYIIHQKNHQQISIQIWAYYKIMSAASKRNKDTVPQG